MRFLSFSKRIRTRSVERSGVSFQGGDMCSQGNHSDFFFFVQKAVAHLATSP
jgi:hypothetical protein